MYCFGGGLNCFGFGTTFSPPTRLDLAPLMQPLLTDASSTSCKASHPALKALSNSGSPSQDNSGGMSCKTSASKDVGHAPTDREKTAASAPLLDRLDPKHRGGAVDSSSSAPRGIDQADTLNASSDPAADNLPVGTAKHQNSWQTTDAALHIPASGKGTSAMGSGRCQHQKGVKQTAFAVEKGHAKAAKDSLRALGWLDRTCKAQADSCGCICLPLTTEGDLHLSQMQTNLVSVHKQSQAQSLGDARQLTHAQTDTRGHFAHRTADLASEQGHSLPQSAELPLNGHALSTHLAAPPQPKVNETAHHLVSHADPRQLDGDSPVMHTTRHGAASSAEMAPQLQVPSAGGVQRSCQPQGRNQNQERDCLKGLLTSHAATLQHLLSPIAPARSGLGPAARLRCLIAELLHQQVPNHLLLILVPVWDLGLLMSGLHDTLLHSCHFTSQFDHTKCSESGCCAVAPCNALKLLWF